MRTNLDRNSQVCFHETLMIGMVIKIMHETVHALFYNHC